MRILLLENDLVLASLICRALREEAYEVDLAQDGREAELMYTSRPYNAIIAELKSPIIDGLSLLADISERGYEIPYLLLTEDSLSAEAFQKLDEVDVNYLKKPFKLRDLLDKLKALCPF